MNRDGWDETKNLDQKKKVLLNRVTKILWHRVCVSQWQSQQANDRYLELTVIGQHEFLVILKNKPHYL